MYPPAISNCPLVLKNIPFLVGQVPPRRGPGFQNRLPRQTSNIQRTGDVTPQYVYGEFLGFAVKVALPATISSRTQAISLAAETEGILCISTGVALEGCGSNRS